MHYGDTIRCPSRGEARRTPSDYHVDDHQRYLAKNPYGYRCHANTGVKFPETA